MSRVLVTGSDGLLGSTLVRVLSDSGHDVTGTDKSSCDIADERAVHDYFDSQSKFDWIVHTAAIVNINLCEEDQTLCHKVNVLGTEHILNRAKKSGARLIYISTVSVFSGFEGDYKETDIPSPSNYHNKTKVMAEKLVFDYELGTVLRMNLVGIHPGGSRGQNFFEWLYDSVKAGKDMKLFTDVVINPLSNWTLAEYIRRIIKDNPQEKIIHVGSSNNLSKADIGRMIIDVVGGYKGQVEYVGVDDVLKVARPKEMWLNTDYAQKELGWEMPTLESEVKKILDKAK